MRMNVQVRRKALMVLISSRLLLVGDGLNEASSGLQAHAHAR